MELSDLLFISRLQDNGGNFMRDILSFVKFFIAMVLLTALVLVIVIFWFLISQNLINV